MSNSPSLYSVYVKNLIQHGFSITIRKNQKGYLLFINRKEKGIFSISELPTLTETLRIASELYLDIVHKISDIDFRNKVNSLNNSF